MNIWFHDKEPSKLPVTNGLYWNLNALLRLKNPLRPQMGLAVASEVVVGRIDVKVSGHTFIPELLVGLFAQTSAI